MNFFEKLIKQKNEWKFIFVQSLKKKRKVKLYRRIQKIKYILTYHKY